jgi:DnaJ-class molecular chaperone
MAGKGDRHRLGVTQREYGAMWDKVFKACDKCDDPGKCTKEECKQAKG